MERLTGVFAARGVLRGQTAIYLASQDVAILAEAKAATCPDAIADWLTARSDKFEHVGMEIGPRADCHWNAVTACNLPILCLDPRCANGVPRMMPDETDWYVAGGLARISRGLRSLRR